VDELAVDCGTEELEAVAVEDDVVVVELGLVAK
jgi:hypothetical protein